MSRRRLLSSGAVFGLGAFAFAATGCEPFLERRLQQVEGRRYPRHSMFVWQFSIDGDAADIAPALAAAGLSVILKTHDGVEWMAKYDPVPGAIAGPEQVSVLARVFEDAGVPFHAWAVVKGVEPEREAAMAADVLDAGARSITLDVEDHEGFWVGTADDAARFGAALRERSPFGRVDISIDPRPWKLGTIPLHEFAEFCDGIRPQCYWDAYNDADHINAYTYMGFPPGADGITPEFLAETTYSLLAPLDRWLIPVAPAAPADEMAFARFVRRSWELGMPEVCVWRYGLAQQARLDYLAANPPGSAPSLG